MALKNLIFILLVLVTGCTSVRKAAGPPSPKNESTRHKKPSFIESISIKPEGKEHIVKDKSDNRSSFDFSKAGPAIPSSIEIANAMLFKYAILMNLPVEELGDTKVYEFLEEWYGTPYKYGGNTKSGIDCSAFTGFLLSSVYGVVVPRTSRQQYAISQKISKNELAPGDLVFFKNRSTISHVGVYLGNNKFAHAATSGGVMISDLDEIYFSRKYAGAGRVLGYNAGGNTESPGSIVTDGKR